MSKFIKVTDAYGRDVYISEVSSMGNDSYGLTEIVTPSGETYSVGESQAEILEELEKIKSPDIKTLRDEFAMAALNGLLSNSGGVVQKSCMSGTGYVNWDNETVSAWAYGLADAMLKERLK